MCYAAMDVAALIASIAYYEELIMHRLVGKAVNQDSAAYGDRSAGSL